MLTAGRLGAAVSMTLRRDGNVVTVEIPGFLTEAKIDDMGTDPTVFGHY